jgi:hypothetical protein
MLAEFFKDYAPPIAWCVGVFGWGISNHHANLREKRKEYRGEIDAIEKTVKELTVKLTGYFEIERDNRERIMLGLDIKMRFKELDLKLERIVKRQSGGTLGLYIDDCKKAKEELFDHATGDYFESMNCIPSDKVNEHLQKVHLL